MAHVGAGGAIPGHNAGGFPTRWVATGAEATRLSPIRDADEQLGGFGPSSVCRCYCDLDDERSGDGGAVTDDSKDDRAGDLAVSGVRAQSACVLTWS